jgi:hypothetical protein
MGKIVRNNCIWKKLRLKLIRIGIKIKINKIINH